MNNQIKHFLGLGNIKAFVLAACLMSLPATTYAKDTVAVNTGQQTEYKFRDTTLTPLERAQDIARQMTLEEKAFLLQGGFSYRGCQRLGIPEFQTADGPLGIASWGIRGRATCFPAPILVAASWDRDLGSRLGDAFAKEWRARGIDICYAPGVNLSRASKSSRNFEYFGEDPYLSGELAADFAKALQEGGVLAVVKHFVANDQEFDRYTVSTEVTERPLRELYLAPFEKVIKKGGALGVMTGYNLVNGTYCAEHPEILNKILRDEWGFRGTVMSDWGATHSTKESIVAGLDYELGTYDFLNYQNIKNLIDNGDITEQQIDQMVVNIYLPLIELGIFDRNAHPDKSLPLFSPENNRLAYEGAVGGMVLLKNENNTLPINPSKVKRIAVIGPNASSSTMNDDQYDVHHVVHGGGGSSKVNPWYVISDLQGIMNEFPDAEITYAEGISPNYLKRVLDRTGVVNFKEHTAYIGPADVVPVDAGNPEQLIAGEETQSWQTTITPAKDDIINLFVRAQGGWRLTADGKVLIDRIDAQSHSDGYAQEEATTGKPINIKLEYRPNGVNPKELRFGWDYASSLPTAEAVKAAENADIVIFSGGFDSAEEYEGTDRTFEMPWGQAELLKALVATGTPVVAVVRGGGGMATEQWIDGVEALLYAGYPGQEGGRAIARILSGAENPSGKLPFSWEARWEDSSSYGHYDETRASRKVLYDEGLMMGYRHFDQPGSPAPLFPFGYGQSYTTFDYSNLDVKPVKGEKYSYAVSFDITNTGDRKGAEAYQVYVSDVKASEPRPIKELKQFGKIELLPGQTERVTVMLDEEAFRFFSDKKKRWTVEPGEFKILVGRSSADTPLSTSINIKK